MILLTAEEVAVQMKICPRTVRKMGIPTVRLGRGKGLLRYRQTDIDIFIMDRLEYALVKGDGNRVQKRSKAVGVQTLPSRETLQALRLAHEGRG